MAHTIYATFPTEHDAEKAAGALIDHGVTTQDISFILPHTTMRVPTDVEGHPIPHQAPLTHAVDAVPPAQIPLPSQIDLANAEANVPPVPTLPVLPDSAVQVRAMQTGAAGTGYHYDALGAVIPDAPLPNSPNTVTVAPPLAPVETPAAPEIVALPGNTSSDALRYEGRHHVLDMNQELPDAASGISTTTGADAAKGAIGGAGIGVGLGILLGLAAVAVPGIGWVAGTGMLVAGLAAATGAAGSIAGGVFGYLTDLGVPEDKARLLHTHLESGYPVLSVNVSGRLSELEIEALLRKYGATAAEAF